MDYQSADSEHVLKRSRPFGIAEEGFAVKSIDFHPAQQILLIEYLDAFDANNSPHESKVLPQKLFIEPVSIRIVEKYPAGEGSDQIKKHIVCPNWLPFGKPLDLQTELTIGFQDHLILGTPASPLRKVLLESSLGDAIILQPQVDIGLKGVSEDDIP
ncbi:putative zinc metalloprotease [Corchorus olitorius]|uniref:Zinc metalloprotease n=1 Tax=Corchorus olitorius TaxID=93759 RepID=A0A1R3JT25_9ROSI|nr:putative zinc metalloprotease [Corchorus olitorius]